METTIITSTPDLKLSEMAENLIGSEIIKLASDVKERIRKGEKIFNYTIGDFDPNIFSLPVEFKNEIIAAYNNNETNYPAANGILELRKAVSKFLNDRGNLDYNENQVLISGGARPLIYATYHVLLDPGDTVLFPVPSWNNNHYSHLARAKQVFFNTKPENNFMPTKDDISPYIKEANLISLCSPLNPTGTVFSREDLQGICDLVLEENNRRNGKQKPVYVLYDQIYWLLTYGETEHFNPVSLRPEMKHYTIIVDGMSKAFAATGVRVGWGVSSQKIINKMRAVLSHVGAWSPRAEQVAAANYLNQEDNVNAYLAEFKSRIKKRLDAFYEGFKSLKAMGFKVDAIAPQAAIYLTVKLDICGFTTKEGLKLETAQDVTKYILDEAKIALVPFYAFGADKNSNWYRLSVGTASMNEIESFFNNLRNALSILS